jgi:5-methylcytosine-specific restriction endonuclease McrA
MSDVLVLNADAQPVSYLPLSAVQWKEAITYMWLDKCDVLEWYDDWVVRSSSWETKVPAVIILKEFQRRRRLPRLSKTNLYLRDLYICQYCNNQFPRSSLTVDHVIPISKGGKTRWDNVVAACNPCNSRKSNKTNIKPKVAPRQPDYYELVNKRKQLDFSIRHPSWESYL